MRAGSLALWTAAVLATAVAFVVHLTLRLENVRLGYAVGEARREEQRLVEARRLFALEVATLSQPDRVETIARGAFGMVVADPALVVHVDERRAEARSPR